MPRVLSQKRRKKVAEEILGCAIDRNGELKNRKSRPPLNQLALGVLYRVTSVRRATRAVRDLQRTFADWNEIRVSHPTEVAAAISTSSWATEGAERLVWMLRELHQMHGHISLDFLSELTPTQARSCLKRLPMVQRAQADEVLLLSLGVEVLPCSADVARMSHRLGLVADDRATVKNQKRLAGMFGDEHFASVHLFFCDYAARTCLPDEPLCGRCPMKAVCHSSNV